MLLWQLGCSWSREADTLLQRHPDPHPRTGSGGQRDMETGSSQSEVWKDKAFETQPRGAQDTRKREKGREARGRLKGTEGREETDRWR